MAQDTGRGVPPLLELGHLQNHGFLYAGRGQWRLAPAFDLNPFPDKDRELKTWLTRLAAG